MHDPGGRRLASLERERLAAFERALLPSLRRQLVLLIAIVIVGARDLSPRVTVAAGLAIVLAAGLLFVARRVSDGSPHPQRWALVEQVLVSGMFAGMMSQTGGVQGPVAPLLFLSVLIGAARFDDVLTRTLLLAAVVAMTGLAQLAAGSSASANAAVLLAWLGAFVCATELVRTLVAAELSARTRADHDGLTGLRNRSALERCLTELDAQSQTTAAPVSLLLCDLDEFKAVNDTLGHAAGDVVLADVAAALRGELPGYDLIFRMGGDEYVVVLPGSSAVQAQAVGDRLGNAIRQAVGSYGVSASIGTATRRRDLASHLLVEADAALYGAKRGGRNRVTAYAA
jgi:diguanylate cyclase (GGDEF)-like protein